MGASKIAGLIALGAVILMAGGCRGDDDPAGGRAFDPGPPASLESHETPPAALAVPPAASPIPERPAPSPRVEPAAPPPSPIYDSPVYLERIPVWITFYTCPPFCRGDITASGTPLGDGMAACSYRWAFGQRFRLGGQLWTCLDRGGGGDYWVDVWLPTREEARAFMAGLDEHAIEMIE